MSDLVVLKQPYLYAYGYSDRSVVVRRRDDLPDDFDGWAGVQDFIREHGLVLAEENSIPAEQPGKFLINSLWTTPERRRQLAAGEISAEDYQADLRQIIGSLLVKYDLY